MRPLADSMRPTKLEDFVGQQHILSKGKPLYNLINSKNICNCIFYGPPGTGKTTLANIMANYVDKKFYKLNATTASVKDIQDITNNMDNLISYTGVVLYIDELQHFNKKQQQALLEFIEDGRITLIASTTENPYFVIHKAIISRCNIFQFKPLEASDIVVGLEKSIRKLIDKGIEVEYSDEALKYISDISQGDYRKAYNILELGINSQVKLVRQISKEYIESLGQSNMRSDSSGDEFYNLLSALQKSIRGSDANAAVHYLARLIKGGNLTGIIRRMCVIAAEDIGLSSPSALSVVNSGVELALKVGLPEARIILSEIVIYLSTLPKSNSAYLAINSAMNDLENINFGDVPMHLKDAHYSGAAKLGVGGYKYPHDYKNHYVEQEYLPKELKDRVYYEEQHNKYEESIRKYWTEIKK
ncbi:replication-associated recombination protein A [Clostridium saccharobutylicum]|uniref:AAA domain-containing protein YrvN n=1 Tax=Clostridium saccharobutylicum DSM 13864 TaxID=1345695 RepID=U5MP67_CLOSA|nr:replication-associated recombination protein A [Clostridium saccharobutylicum]AGX42323.1 AAA domain-containing protein YrvN [Clostridium saccharobutylicum DSM 13864]AQR89604.1 replication-associated recombination protein A [Clostridium saccharobutylicum]AQR99506.1 replication-associated recombination protein A [Clostridium saccharobutylicum]AQS09238.1 replication-associated recombination protein A [Clostridium saccharobutylicum]AQS13492.1 replication-associated recombination protein A [Clos